MKKRPDISDSNNERLSEHGKRLAVSLLVMLFVVYSFIVFSIAWFSSAKQIKSRGMSVAVAGVSTTDYTLYKWENNSWNAVVKIDLPLAVANETDRYMVVTAVPFRQASFVLSPVTTADGLTDNNLYNYIYIRKMQEFPDAKTSDYNPEGIELLGYNDILSDQNTAGCAPVSPTKFTNYTLTADNICQTIIFDIYFSKKVENNFGGWSLSGTLTLA